MVVGELACGSLPDRGYVLDLLTELPQIPVADRDEVLFFIEQNRLMGRGVGCVDAHLLAAASLHGSARLWTTDSRLRDAARDLGLDDPAEGLC